MSSGSKPEAYCLRFDLAAERGHRRDDIRPGLRIVGFERRVAIAFTVDEASVTVLRVFYGGQDWGSMLRRDSNYRDSLIFINDDGVLRPGVRN